MANLAALCQFLSNVRGVDLATVTSPSFLLAPISATEAGRCWTCRPAIFAAPALEPSAEKRAMLMLRWILLTLKQQFYMSAVGEGAGIKKPLNPFLGELFVASWTDQTATANLVTEQVSHHPPITALHMWDDENGIRGTGYSRVEMVFNTGFGSGDSSGLGVDIKQSGHAVVHIDKYDEDHVVVAPRARIKGFLSGTLYPELVGTTYIASTSGYVSEIRFCPPDASSSGMTSWLKFGGGPRNRFEAVLYHKDDPDKTPLYTASGSWSGKFDISDARTGAVLESHDLTSEETCQATNGPLPAEDIPTRDDMCAWETRRAWGPVMDALRRGDMGEAARQKTKLETAQREMRAEEARCGRSFEPLFFKNLDGDYAVHTALGESIGWDLDSHRTKGVWVADEESIKSKTQRPFRAEETPLGL